MTVEDKIEILFHNLYEDVPYLKRFDKCTDLEVKECFSNLHLLSKAMVDCDNFSVISREDVDTKCGKIVYIKNLFVCSNFRDIVDSLVRWSDKNYSGKLLTILIFYNSDNLKYYVNIRIYA